MTRYLLRKRAEADLEDIWRFTVQRWDLAQAETYVDALLAAFGRLGEQPTLGKACEEIRAGYRRYVVGSHVVFYVMTDGVVDIVRILHARRDFRRHLPE